MAQIDFTNAVLEPNGTYKPMTFDWLMYTWGDDYLFNAGKSSISTGSQTVVLNSPTKATIVKTGTFTASGTEFYIGYYDRVSTQIPWKVSNISFNAGDTYSFAIDIEVSGNT